MAPIDLMEQLLQAKTGEERTSLFKNMMHKLLVHAHAEQDVLYRKMKQSDDERAGNKARLDDPDVPLGVYPRANEKDLPEIPDNILKTIKLIAVDSIDDVFRWAIPSAPPRPALGSRRSERSSIIT